MKKNRKQLAHSINFRLDDGLYNRIINGADMARLTKGEYIRQQLAKGRVTVRQELIVDIIDLKKVIAELGKIGSNLNQIARHFNGGGADSSYLHDRIMQALADLFDMKYEIEKLGGEFRGYSQARCHPKQ